MLSLCSKLSGLSKFARFASVTELAQIVAPRLGEKPELSEVLNAVYDSNEVTSQCPNLIIRLTSLRASVAKEIWGSLGNDEADVQVLAIGSVAIPSHLENYQKSITNFYEKTAQLQLEHVHGLDKEYPVGYDLLATGAEESRMACIKMFSEHYGFSEEAMEKMRSNSALANGGVRALKDLFESMFEYALANGEMHRCVQPDNSFGTYWNVIKSNFDTEHAKAQREICTIETTAENKLQLSAEDVHQFYETHEPKDYESWYITPVGNPSGTAMDGKQLEGVCKAVLEHNPKALLFLDSVYCRTLPVERCLDLFSGVVNNPEVLNRSIFLESFSKSHGLCGERLGIYFTTNPEIFTSCHTANISYSAGNGRFRDYQFKALSEPTEVDKAGLSELHEFWRAEREGLLEYLTSGEFSDLFTSEQPHIDIADYTGPCGLYVTLRMNPGVTGKDVFVRTGKAGVEGKLAGEQYVRFSVGLITEPTFSK